ncbi:MAG: hypothetical protein ABJC26_17745, partial [Gemmatimonadaceae bacterium]
YASFKTRITETYWFLEEVLGYVAKNGKNIQSVVATANTESIVGQQLAVREVLVKAPELKEVVFVPTLSVRNPYVADRPYRLRPDGNLNRSTEMLPFFGLTEATETSLAPRVYVIPNTTSTAAATPPAGPPAGGGGVGGGRGGRGGGGGGGGFGGGGGTPTQRMIAGVVDRLEAHGIKYITTDKEMPFTGEQFKIATNTMVDQTYQGTHKARTLTGAWENSTQTLPVGSIIIPMDQPLARLSFILFDPRSEDGFMWWNILDAVLGQAQSPTYYPVLRSMNAMRN